MNSIRRLLFSLLLLSAITLLTTSCDKNDCECTPPPQPVFSVSLLTKVPNWRLEELTVGGQSTKGSAIKDQFSLAFKADGTYQQILLADGTSTQGTFMLMDDHYSTLHLTDFKSATHEYTLLRADDQILSYTRLNKEGVREYYNFLPVR